MVYPSDLVYGVGLWCTAACRYATPGWTDVLKPGQRKTSTCGVCEQRFETVLSKRAVYCSRTCAGIANGLRQRQKRDPSKRTTKTCEECQAPFVAWLSQADRVRFCSKSCNARWWCRRRRVIRPTSIELALEAALSMADIATVREMKAGRFSIDLAIPSAQIAIEADGKYWHSLPKQIAADARKNAALTAQGWTVLRFGEDEINADVASCVAVVLEALRSRAG